MKTPFAARFAARLASLGMAAFLTVAMLGSVDYLATSEPAAGGVMAAASQPSA